LVDRSMMERMWARSCSTLLYLVSFKVIFI
jgi:hypothetical protein